MQNTCNIHAILYKSKPLKERKNGNIKRVQNPFLKRCMLTINMSDSKTKQGVMYILIRA